MKKKLFSFLILSILILNTQFLKAEGTPPDKPRLPTGPPPPPPLPPPPPRPIQ